MFDVLRFWLERGVDGFRIDAVRRIMKDPELRDNPPNPDGRRRLHKPQGEYDQQLHLNDMRHPDIHAVLRELRQVLEAYERADGRPRVAIGEIHDLRLADAVPLLRRDAGRAAPAVQLRPAGRRRGTRGAIRDAGRRATRRPCRPAPGRTTSWATTTSHGSPRRVGPRRRALAMLLLLTLRGTPTLYYGDELGMQDVPIPPEQAQDPWGKNVPGSGWAATRSARRCRGTPTPNAGFCPPDVDALAADRGRRRPRSTSPRSWPILARCCP